MQRKTIAIFNNSNNKHKNDYLHRIDDWMFMHITVIIDKTPER